MTAHTQACCANRRSLIEARIVANLSQLTQLPAVIVSVMAGQPVCLLVRGSAARSAICGNALLFP